MFPHNISAVLTVQKFLDLHQTLKNDWSCSNTSYSGGAQSWGKICRNDLINFSVGSYIKLKLMKVLKKDLRLIKVQINGQTPFQESQFHIDFSESKVWTFVLFTEPEWNVEWGGEFVVQDSAGKYHYTPYIPNTGVLIPSNWTHKGQSPNSQCPGMRTTVAFSYCASDIIDIMCYNYSYINKFL